MSKKKKTTNAFVIRAPNPLGVEGSPIYVKDDAGRAHHIPDPPSGHGWTATFYDFATREVTHRELGPEEIKMFSDITAKHLAGKKRRS